MRLFVVTLLFVVAAGCRATPTSNKGSDSRPAGDSLKVGGRPLTVAAVDPFTVTVAFPQTFAPGVRILDNLVILPRHKLDSALKSGSLQKTWGLSTPPSELAGLGPFVLASYQPGQRLSFVRNSHYWRRDEHGAPLP